MEESINSEKSNLSEGIIKSISLKINKNNIESVNNSFSNESPHLSSFNLPETRLLLWYASFILFPFL